MAVIQISKIQHRRGAIGEQGMPQLASGELGWAVDTQQLFIGNGSVAEGAPAVGNTEVLTQYSTATINLFNSLYNFNMGQDPNINPVVLTGADANHPLDRRLQSKLDEYVSILDFGADPTGKTDSSVAIQKAVKQIYMNPNDSKSDDSFKKILHFPAGTYKITGTVYIPPNASLLGEGPERSVLISVTTGNNTILQTRSLWGNTSTAFLPLNQGLSTPVNNVSISSLGFQYGANIALYTVTTNPTALLNLDMTTNSRVVGCKFMGTYTNNVLSVANLGQVHVPYSGIYVSGSTTYNIQIENNTFNQLILGSYGYDDSQYISYINNVFDTNYIGIKLGSAITSPTNSSGPLYGQAHINKFLKIYAQGLDINAPKNNTTTTSFVSNSNLFSNVGNASIGNESGQIFQCIAFTNATGCVSINDKFTRFGLAQNIYSTSTFKPMVTGQALVIDDRTAYRYPINWTSTATLIRIPYLTTMTGVVMEYQLQKNTGIRKGVLKVTASPYQAGTVTYTDQYNYFGTEPGVVLTAKLINSTNSNITTVFDCIAIQYENDRNTNFPSNTGTGLISLTIKYQT